MKTTTVRRPLLDRNGFDVFSGKFVGRQELTEHTKNYVEKRKKSITARWDKELAETGKMYVDGLGRVTP